MKKAFIGALMLAPLFLGGCGTPAAKDFRGSWKPVNRFQSAPTEIPLDQPYTFYASPMDETLKTMLDRWSKDTGRTLSYKLDYDVTLYEPVADIHTADIQTAAAKLNEIYASQGVEVIAQPREILVQIAGSSAASLAAPMQDKTAKTARPGSAKR